jgi:putative sigma-54 modulation protein
MRLVLTGRHLEISPGLRTLVDRKLLRLERVLSNAIVSAQVVCSRQKSRVEADVTVHMRGDHTLAGRATGTTWNAALTAVLDKIERQGSKVKGKWKERKRGAAPVRRRTPAAAAAAAAGEAAASGVAVPPSGNGGRPPGPRIVAVSDAQLKPMTVENAALELAATGEAFLVFRNAETDGLNVLLRRSAGEFGLLETDR